MSETQHKASMYFKISFYILSSILIGFSTQIDNIQSFDTFHALDWIKLIIKSILPAVIAVKAFFDTSVSNYLKSSDQE